VFSHGFLLQSHSAGIHTDVACTGGLQALRLLGVHDRADFDELYAQIDLDDSGYIDKDEFGAWWFDLERDVD
jgi:hypothetical protein